jgi:serine/threonine protein kinase
MTTTTSLAAEESARDLPAGAELLPGLSAWTLLGGGSHCESWLAWSVDLWAPVVVKLPRPDEAADADVWEDLLLEARAHAGVSHPGFQRLWRAELEAPVPHLVLEYVEGPSLDTLRTSGELTVPDVVLLGLQLVSSLRHLHRRGLAHLDVKPSNIVLREGRPVLIDLGIVTPTGRTYRPDAAPGTPAYMAPELVRDGHVTAACDVYGLGVSLRELLRDAPPDAPLDQLLAQMTDADPARRPVGDTILAELHALLARSGSTLWPAWVTALI